ncbi:MAG: sigma-54-dependent Fis family transcriptional regulator [Deltaproteobacteria bacterium]|nr:sigma-54-dependent Fis family transcriptional regulator [Deltaproteobacteria bacterium]
MRFNQRDENEYRAATMREVMAMARSAAQHDGPVLLLGETGTGKEHLARWIHERSWRGDEPFFVFDCAGTQPKRAEAVLFGDETASAIPGRRRRGLLEQADKGTLLVAEFPRLDLVLQRRLLLHLDSVAFARSSRKTSTCPDTRIIMSSRRDILAEDCEGEVLEALRDTLSSSMIRLPPLRDRLEDLELLVGELVAELSLELDVECPALIDAGAMAALKSSSWPGNIRALRNVLERAVMNHTGGQICTRDLGLDFQSDDWNMVVKFPNGQSLHDVTRDVARGVVQEALRRCHGKQEVAARLGISRHSLAYQLRVLGLEDKIEQPSAFVAEAYRRLTG